MSMLSCLSALAESLSTALDQVCGELHCTMSVVFIFMLLMIITDCLNVLKATRPFEVLHPCKGRMWLLTEAEPILNGL